MLKDWDFARFFPSKASDNSGKQEKQKNEENKRAQLQRQSKIDIDETLANYKAIATPPSRHKLLFSKSVDKSTHEKLSDIFNKHKKLQDSGSKTPFFRAFRRENSDLSHMPNTRHSAIYFPKNDIKSNINDPLRSSGIFNQSRSHAVKSTTGEPVLVDFIKFNDSLKASHMEKNKKEDPNTEKRFGGSNPNDALKSIAALIKQDSENDNISRQSSVNSDSPVASVTNSIVYTKNTSFEKANTPDLTAHTSDLNANADVDKETINADSIMKPRREKTESDIVFRKNSNYKRHTELISSCGQEAVLTRDQVIVLRLG